MDELRPLLFSIAYRMLGSVGDAEDVVQEALLRYDQAEGVESPKAWLTSVVTRLAIDQLRSARARRETYVGEWLPEPLVNGDDDPAAHAEQADTLSMAFLLLLERLTPVERAVFLLHDVFAYRYDEIADLIGRSEANCRQLGVRARRHVEAEKPRFEASRHERDELAARFFAAVQDGDVDELVGMLAADAVVVGDGGGKAPQWATPIVGPERIAKLLAGTGMQMRRHGMRLERRHVNGQPGAVLRMANGDVAVVWTVEIADGAVQALRSVINPDKLRHLGPVADLRALLRAERGR
ncbi:MAG TPA: RNA polymerase sigma-70 factor [Gaiellaceae bacterium]|jgi:RNA polymerase sigma-70 factor, ECF subfamily